MLITGAKGAGKSTLLRAIIEGTAPTGVQSSVERGADGLPARIWLGAWDGARECVIGTRGADGMRPHRDAFDATGVELVRAARLSPGEWAAVDEIGFLEECSPRYIDELRQLFDCKRVLAAVRKADTPFICELRARADCCVLDLDELEEGQWTQDV